MLVRWYAALDARWRAFVADIFEPTIAQTHSAEWESARRVRQLAAFTVPAGTLFPHGIEDELR